VRRLWRANERLIELRLLDLEPWNQCMATVSGIGGFYQRNSFYTPRASASRSRKRAYYNY
jgi:hypothetical protein